MFYVDFIVSYIFKKFWFIFILKEVVFVVVLIFIFDEERIIEKDDLYLVIKECLIYWYYLDVIFIYFCFKIIRICEIMVLMGIMFF